MKRILLSAIAVVGIVVYSLWVMFVARDSAMRLASGRPYCMQVATINGYRELSSVTQLAGLRMYGWRSLNHAVLVIGDLHQPRLLHWSYRANSFVEGAYGPPPLYCRPRQNFLNTLEYSAERDARMLFMAYGGYEFWIPRSYRPRLMWPNQTLMLTARAPNFVPTDGRLFEGKLATLIQLDFTSDGRLERWRVRTDDDHRIESLGEQFGLIKERTWHRGSNEPHLQYYSLQKDGTDETLISCVSEKPEYQCEHTFKSDGRLYYIHVMPQDIAQWRDTQARLVGLLDSFVVGSRRWSAL